MKGCIASGSTYTSQAGQFAFAQGGNAFDALICAQFAACVVEPLLTGLGGAGLAVFKHQGNHQFLDMFSSMPLFDGEGWKPDLLDEVILDFGSTTQRFHVGEHSIATPTVPQSLLLLHHRYASLPLETLLEPACKFAEEGFIVNDMSAFILDLLHPIYKHNEMMCRWYTKNGRTLQKGDVCKPREMRSDFLKLLCHKEDFWSEILQKNNYLHNSLLKNISEYSPKITKCLYLNKGSFKVYIPPMPSIGGIISADLMRVLQRFESVHDIKSYVKVAHKAQYSTEAKILETFQQGESGFTTHISVVDEIGNAISMTTSLGETSGITIPGTGIILNNFLGEADVAHPIVVQHPGRRLITMCTPMILEFGQETAALGSGGSSRIPHAMSQVVLRYCEDMDTSWTQAIEASRFYPNFSEKFELCIEKNSFSENFIAELQTEFGTALKIFDQPSMYFGGVHVASVTNHDNQIYFKGGADPRRQGCIL